MYASIDLVSSLFVKVQVPVVCLVDQSEFKVFFLADKESSKYRA